MRNDHQFLSAQVSRALADNLVGEAQFTPEQIDSIYNLVGIAAQAAYTEGFHAMGALQWARQRAERREADARQAEMLKDAAEKERHGWADYFDRLGSETGAPELTPERVADLLRGSRPFGTEASS